MAEGIDILRDITMTPPLSKRECFLKFATLNMMNALVKTDEYKGVVKYWQIKPKVYELVKMILETGHKEYFDSIYFDKNEKCIYIVIYSLQFSYHNVTFDGLNDDDKNYITSYPQTWEGLRLQPVSEAIYNKALEIQGDDLKEDEIQGIIALLKKDISDGKETI